MFSGLTTTDLEVNCLIYTVTDGPENAAEFPFMYHRRNDTRVVKLSPSNGRCDENTQIMVTVANFPVVEAPEQICISMATTPNACVGQVQNVLYSTPDETQFLFSNLPSSNDMQARMPLATCCFSVMCISYDSCECFCGRQCTSAILVDPALSQRCSSANPSRAFG